MTKLYKKEMKELNKVIGLRLREVRRKRSISMGRLAKAVGLTQQQISKYELGEDRVSAAMLVQISRVLLVSPCIFFGGFKVQQTAQLNSNIPIIHKALQLTSQTMDLLKSIQNHK